MIKLSEASASANSASPERAFLPPEPGSIAATGLPQSTVESLILKRLLTGNVLTGQVLELLGKNIGILEQVDDRVDTVGNADQVSAERTAVFVVNIDSLEQILGLGEALKQAIQAHTRNDVTDQCSQPRVEWHS